jgi:inosine-uridine nucleoside N-ribohydrolase
VTELYREDYGTRYPGFFQNPDAVGYLWDELATGYVIDPAIVGGLEKKYLDVETRFGPDYGAVIPLDRALAPQASPVEQITKVDAERAFRLYRELLTR